MAKNRKYNIYFINKIYQIDDCYRIESESPRQGLISYLNTMDYDCLVSPSYDGNCDVKVCLLDNKGSIKKENCYKFIYISKKKNEEITPIVVSESSAMHAYSGLELEEYAKNHIQRTKKARYFATQIYQRIKKKIMVDKVIAVRGLRGTGKTTGLMHIIDFIKEYDNTVYITIDSGTIVTNKELKEMINKYKEKKYIFIDEITRIENFVEGCSYLYDDYVNSGKIVVISGTDSFALSEAKKNGLYHRMYDQIVTFISFPETRDTLGLTLSEYINYGGLYIQEDVKTLEEAIDYVDTSVIDNIMNTLIKNSKIKKLVGVEEQEIRTIVFKILYSIIYKGICETGNKEINISFKLILDEFITDEIKSMVGLQEISDTLYDAHGIEKTIIVENRIINEILKILLDMELIVEIKNIVNPLERNYYITNPLLYNHLYKELIEILYDMGLVKKPVSNNIVAGHLFESIVVVHTKRYADKNGLTLYYYHDEKNKEVDLIIEKEERQEDISERNLAYYEIKLSSKADVAILRSKWIKDNEITRYMESRGRIQGTGIVYTGKTKEYVGIENIAKELTDQERYLLEQNKGIKLISAEEFILNPAIYCSL